MQIRTPKLNTFSCILTKLYGIYMKQKYKKKADYANISMIKCCIFSIFNHEYACFGL